FFFFSSRRRHTRFSRDWSSDVCSSDLEPDASVLMIPLLGFLPAEDPRVRATLRWIEQGLLRDGLVYRFPPHLGAAGWEGAFLACSFWMVDNLIMSGQQQKAETLFHRLLALRNDV